jgi:predicted house-cleaning noncanonical NTP pyrophosphatase (MazG superfamily)
LPCWKLVRDRIGEELSGSVLVLRASGGELERLLRFKLVEEAVEFALTGSIEELADLVDVVEALLRLRGLSWDAVERVRAEKRRRFGGFEAGVVAVWLDRDRC